MCGLDFDEHKEPPGPEAAGGTLAVSWSLSAFAGNCQVDHGGADIHFPETACPPTICELKQNSPTYWHRENLEPNF